MKSNIKDRYRRQRYKQNRKNNSYRRVRLSKGNTNRTKARSIRKKNDNEEEPESLFILNICNLLIKKSNKIFKYIKEPALWLGRSLEHSTSEKLWAWADSSKFWVARLHANAYYKCPRFFRFFALLNWSHIWQISPISWSHHSIYFYANWVPCRQHRCWFGEHIVVTPIVEEINTLVSLDNLCKSASIEVNDYLREPNLLFKLILPPELDVFELDVLFKMEDCIWAYRNESSWLESYIVSYNYLYIKLKHKNKISTHDHYQRYLDYVPGNRCLEFCNLIELLLFGKI